MSGERTAWVSDPFPDVRAGRPDFLCTCGCRESGRAASRGAEVRGWVCDNCGGGLMYQTETCQCGAARGQSHRTSTITRPATALSGIEALRILQSRYRAS